MPLDAQRMLLDRLDKIDRSQETISKKQDDIIERLTRVEERQRDFDSLKTAVENLQEQQDKASGAGAIFVRVVAVIGWIIGLYFGVLAK